MRCDDWRRNDQYIPCGAGGVDGLWVGGCGKGKGWISRTALYHSVMPGPLYYSLSLPFSYNCAVNLARERTGTGRCGRARCGGALQWHTHGPCACRTTAGAGIRLMRSGWSTSGYAAPAPALCQRHNGTQGVSARHGCTEHEGNRACLAYAYAAVPFKECSVRAPSLRATARMIHQTKAL